MNDKSSQETRTIFINTNGLNIGTDLHSINKMFTNSKSQQFNILMLAETNTHWRNKRAKDRFRNTIAKEWSGTSTITSETNLA